MIDLSVPICEVRMTTRLKEILSFRNPATRWTLLTGMAFILGFIALAIAGIQVWEWSNSTSFCSNACHDVHPEEPAAYQDSYHARVKCVECHMSRVGTLYNIVLKSGHAKHLPAVLWADTSTLRKRKRCARPTNRASAATGRPPSTATRCERSGVFSRTKITPKSASI